MITEFIGFFIIVGVLIAVIIRRQTKKTDREPANVTSVSQDLQRELERVGSQMVDRVEISMDRLEALIGQADQKIARMDEKIAQLEALEKSGEQIQAAENTTESFAELLLAAEKAPRDTEKEQVQQMFPAVGKPVKEKLNSSRNQLVFSLMDQGCTEEEISRQTGIGKNGLGLLREIYKINRDRLK